MRADSNVEKNYIIDNESINFETNKYNHNQPVYVANFQSIDEADNWLETQKNIVIKDISVNGQVAGFFSKNMIDVNCIKIEYLLCNGAININYGLHIFSKKRMFIQSNMEKRKAKWQELNPEYKWLKGLRFARRYSLLSNRVGFWRVIKEVYVVLYLRNDNC